MQKLLNMHAANVQSDWMLEVFTCPTGELRCQLDNQSFRGKVRDFPKCT